MPEQPKPKRRKLPITCDDVVSFEIEFTGEIIGIKALKGITEIYHHNSTEPRARNYANITTAFRNIDDISDTDAASLYRGAIENCSDTCLEIKDFGMIEFRRGMQDGYAGGYAAAELAWKAKIGDALSKVKVWLASNTRKAVDEVEATKGLRVIRKNFDVDAISKGLRHARKLQEIADKHFKDEDEEGLVPRWGRMAVEGAALNADQITMMCLTFCEEKEFIESELPIRTIKHIMKNRSAAIKKIKLLVKKYGTSEDKKLYDSMKVAVFGKGATQRH